MGGVKNDKIFPQIHRVFSNQQILKIENLTDFQYNNTFASLCLGGIDQ